MSIILSSLRGLWNIILTLTIVTVLATVTNARWLSPGEDDLVVNYMNHYITINDDNHSRVTEVCATIITERGKDKAIAWNAYYNPSHQTLEVLEAYTMVGKKKHKVPNKFIEDKMLYSCGVGFDRINKLTIAFPKAEIGAKIYLKLRYNSNYAVDKHYSDIFPFNGEYKKYSCKINSSVPIYVNINDPENVLKATQVKKDKKGRYYQEIKLKKPIAKGTIKEPHSSFIPEDRRTQFSISTDSSWDNVGKKIHRDYFVVINQPLPDQLKDIVHNAKKYSDSKEQINFITSTLHESLNNGLRKSQCTVDGKLIPRDLIRIIDVGIADSKDFVVAAAAILKQLQYEVYPVLACGGELLSSQAVLPNMIDIYRLDYAALKVIDSSGKVYWLDPTSSVSAAGSIPSLIHNRMVLVLNPQGATYEQVPDIQPEYSQLIHDTTISLQSNRNINYKGTILLKGSYAAMLTGSALYTSPEIIKEEVFNSISKVQLDSHNKKNIVIPDLTSRIVQDYTIEYEYQDNKRTLITNLGYALPLPTFSIYTRISDVIPEQVGDLYIGLPETVYHRIIIKGYKLDSIDKLNYAIDTPWIHIERSCKHIGDDTEIVNKYVLHKSIISNLDLQGEVYKKLKIDIERNLNNTLVIIGNQ